MKWQFMRLLICFFDMLPASAAAYEIVQDKKNIEYMFKTVVRGRRYPYRTYSDDTVNVVRTAG